MAPPCPELEGPSSFFPLWGPKEPAPLARSLNPTPSTAAVPAAVLFAETTLHPRSRERAAGAERQPGPSAPLRMPCPDPRSRDMWTRP